MSFILSEYVLHVAAKLTHGDHDLLRLRLLHAWIVRPLNDKQRSCDLLGREQRRLRHQSLAILGVIRITHANVPDLDERPPVCRERLDQGDQARRAHVRHARRIQIRREGQARQRRVTAVRAAEDADALRISDALIDQVLDPVADVVLHRARAPLVVAGVQVRFAIAGRAAEIRLQHDVAAIGEELRVRVVAPIVARPRSAVRQDHRGQTLGLDAARQRQVGGDLQTVAGFVADRLHVGQLLARQLRPRAVQQCHHFRLAVVQIPGTRVHIAAHGHEMQSLILGR